MGFNSGFKGLIFHEFRKEKLRKFVHLSWTKKKLYTEEYYETLWHSVSQGKGKVKVTLVQALRLCTDRTAHRGSRDIALLFRDHCPRRG